MKYCKKCDDVGIKRRAHFGDPKTGKTESCSVHAEIGWKAIGKITCRYIGCNIAPTFGDPNIGKAETCFGHKEIGYEDVKHKKCEITGCSSRPHFGKEGTKIGKRCSIHKKPDDKQVVRTGLCKHIDDNGKECMKNRSFGKVGTKTALFCGDHIPDEGDYENVSDKKCEVCGITIASFRLEHEKQYRWCERDAPDNAISYGKKCNDCKTKRATHGNPATNIKTHCGECKPDNYIFIGKRRECEYPDCKSLPSYGYEGDDFPTRCAEHFLVEMENIKTKKCKLCKTIANYNYAGFSPDFCSKHQKPRMIPFPHRSEREEAKDCLYCCYPIQYDEIVCKRCDTKIELGCSVPEKRKENRMRDLLEENDIKFIHNETVKGGTSKARPDFLISTFWGTVIVEVDEHQHKYNVYDCEKVRMEKIYHDLRQEYLVFIRYNPDNYKAKRGTKKLNQKDRESYFIKFLNKILEEGCPDPLTSYYLFYDKFDIEEPEFDVILEPEQVVSKWSKFNF